MSDMPNLLAQLPDMTFAFILVLARTGSALLIGPVLGDAEIPPTVRIALAVLISAWSIRCCVSICRRCQARCQR